MLEDFSGWLAKLLRQQVHQVLHKVTLSHQQVLANRQRVTLKLELLEQDGHERLVCDLVCVLHPLVETIENLMRRTLCQQLLRVERDLQ